MEWTWEISALISKQDQHSTRDTVTPYPWRHLVWQCLLLEILLVLVDVNLLLPYDCWTSLHVADDHLHSLFREVPFQIFGSIFVELFDPYYWLEEVNTNFLINSEHFLSVCGLQFHSLNGIFQTAEYFILVAATLSAFLLWVIFFCILSMAHLTNSGYKSFSCITFKKFCDFRSQTRCL